MEDDIGSNSIVESAIGGSIGPNALLFFFVFVFDDDEKPEIVAMLGPDEPQEQIVDKELTDHKSTTLRVEAAGEDGEHRKRHIVEIAENVSEMDADEQQSSHQEDIFFNIYNYIAHNNSYR